MEETLGVERLGIIDETWGEESVLFGGFWLLQEDGEFSDFWKFFYIVIDFLSGSEFSYELGYELVDLLYHCCILLGEEGRD